VRRPREHGIEIGCLKVCGFGGLRARDDFRACRSEKNAARRARDEGPMAERASAVTPPMPVMSRKLSCPTARPLMSAEMSGAMPLCRNASPIRWARPVKAAELAEPRDAPPGAEHPAWRGSPHLGRPLAACITTAEHS
jgi:hypothetical protein